MSRRYSTSIAREKVSSLSVPSPDPKFLNPHISVDLNPSLNSAYAEHIYLEVSSTAINETGIQGHACREASPTAPEDEHEILLEGQHS